MCTVTYIPYDNGCWLTSNRDEKPGRHPSEPARWHTPPTGQPLYYASDAKAGGTWMATNAQGHTAVLLNGAGKPFVPQSHYARSRGLVLLDLLRAPDFVEAFAQADLHNIAPFTCIYVARHQLYACMWDGQTSETQALDDRAPYIWSSSTLYDATAQQQRQFWFGQWLQQNPEPCWQNILEFHHHRNEADPENSLRMQRSSGTQTLSISAVHLHARGPEFFNFDVLQPQPA